MRVTSPGPRLYCHNLDDNLMTAPIGLSVKRREDRRFLTGRGRYVDDLRLPDLLHAAIVRSPHAHARILGVDTNRALALPGVVAVLTITELPECVAAVPPRVPSPRLRPYAQPAIAGAKARYAGEAVAVVVADDVYRATDGASVVDVRYDVLPAAVTVDAALATGAPRVFDDWPDNAAGPSDGAVGDIVPGDGARSRSAPSSGARWRPRRRDHRGRDRVHARRRRLSGDRRRHFPEHHQSFAGAVPDRAPQGLGRQRRDPQDVHRRLSRRRAARGRLRARSASRPRGPAGPPGSRGPASTQSHPRRRDALHDGASIPRRSPDRLRSSRLSSRVRSLARELRLRG